MTSDTGPARYGFLRRWEHGWPVPCRLEASRESRTSSALGDVLRIATVEAIAGWNDSVSTELLVLTGEGAANRSAGASAGAIPGTVPEAVVGWRNGSHGACQAFEGGEHLAHTVREAGGFAVHLDAGREWTPQSLRHAVAHELGHVLGLAHSDDPQALMHPSSQDPLDAPATSDRAGLRSLYGLGRPQSGDLVLAPDEGAEERLLLAGFADRRYYAWDVLDTDGDGDHEVLVWRTDDAGYGTLRIVHFVTGAGGPLVERSVGPLPGVAVPGRRHVVGKAADGSPVFVSLLEKGRYLARRFDARGLPVPREASPLSVDGVDGLWLDKDGDGVWDVRPASKPEGSAAMEKRCVDLDGDGVLEWVSGVLR